VVLAIGGSDSSAGAGVQADLKTFAALGVYGLTAITCIVAETPGKVLRIQPADPNIVREQIELLLSNFPVAAVKTGLLCNAQIASIVAKTLRDGRRKSRAGKLVIDPVMIATSGDALLEQGAIEIYEREIFPIATLITPNLDEAARLLGDPIRNLPQMRRAVTALTQKYGVAVLLKGGHLSGSRAVDVLHDRIRIREFSAQFIRPVATHGTGCTYSAAITSVLAKGGELTGAIKIGKRFVSQAIGRHFFWQRDRDKIFALNQSLNSSRD
jgi:hydroxymethylpyrimidine/phosphomethylpyrimidine kinase